MIITDPATLRDGRSEHQPPAGHAEAQIGVLLPASRKRVRFRYWLGAIALGGSIWAGIAVAIGLV